jgi:hypothetical protein
MAKPVFCRNLKDIFIIRTLAAKSDKCLDSHPWH